MIASEKTVDVFSVAFDHSKVKGRYANKNDKQEATGVRFPSGAICLDLGHMLLLYGSRHEMEIALSAQGSCEIEGLDD